jgi:hypothetical protein
MVRPNRRRREQAKLPRYLPAVLAIGRTLKPGTVQVIEVRHDDWCALLVQGGRCDCNPEVRLPRPVDGEPRR